MPSPHLHRKLQESLGDDAGEELAAMIDRIDPIRGDIAELRHAVTSDIAVLRHEMKQGFGLLETKMEAGSTALRKEVDAAIATSAKEGTRFLFLAWAVLLAAIVGLYSR